MDDYFDRVETQLGELIEHGAHRRRRFVTGPRLPRIPVGALALAGSTAVALAIVAVVLLSVHRRPPPLSGGAGVGADQIDPSLVRSFKILRRPLTRVARLPAGFATGGFKGIERGQFSRSTTWITSEARPPGVAGIGLLPALTQLTTIRGTGYSAWLIPGRHGMCWFTRSSSSSNGPPFPYPAVCVGSLAHPATDLIDGPWTDVETSDQSIVGLVTDRVRAVMLVNGAGPGHRVPLSNGFYVSPLPTGHERLVALTPSGAQPLYPQATPKPPRIVGSATRTIARSSRPEVVLTGSRGLHVQLMSEMSCMTPKAAAGDSGDTGIVRGYQHHAAYQVPAVVPIGFPSESSRLPVCYTSVIVQAGARTRGTVRVAIAER